MNKKDYDFRNETGTWQTGRTQPPKRYGGLIAFLLVLVILLSGISTALSILNFKLYKKLTQPEEQPRVSFSREADPAETEASYEEDLSLQGFGIQGTLIPAVYQRYYKLPKGIYVSRVADRSEAQEKGLVAGDIITALDGYPIHDGAMLDTWAEEKEAGETVELTVFRTGSELSVTLTWSEFN